MSAHNPKHTSDRITVGLKFPFHTKCFAPGVERTSDRRAVLKANLNLPPMASLSYCRQSAISLRHGSASEVISCSCGGSGSSLNGRTATVWDAIRISKFVENAGICNSDALRPTEVSLGSGHRTGHRRSDEDDVGDDCHRRQTIADQIASCRFNGKSF